MGTGEDAANERVSEPLRTSETTENTIGYMADRHRLTAVEVVIEDGSWLFTGRNERGEEIEVVLVPCDEGDDDRDILAWVNRCTHEDQRLYREGVGAVIRDGGIICPKHGSIFDSCSGACQNGPASGSTLPSVEIEVENGQVYLTDEDLTYLYEGPSRSVTNDEDDSMPSSTSHLRF